MCFQVNAPVSSVLETALQNLIAEGALGPDATVQDLVLLMLANRNNSAQFTDDVTQSPDDVNQSTDDVTQSNDDVTHRQRRGLWDWWGTAKSWASSAKNATVGTLDTARTWASSAKNATVGWVSSAKNATVGSLTKLKDKIY